MTKANKKVRTEVIDLWERSGQPRWDVSKTMDACIEIDAQLEKLGQMPAAQFRRAVRQDNKKYIRTWTLGCHFPWLNPRT